jgi:hypothetical protein
MAVRMADVGEDFFRRQQHDAIVAHLQLLGHLSGILGVREHDEGVAGGVKRAAHTDHFFCQFKLLHGESFHALRCVNESLRRGNWGFSGQRLHPLPVRRGRQGPTVAHCV